MTFWEMLTDKALINTRPVSPHHPADAGVDQAILVATAVDGADIRHTEVELNLCMPGKVMSTARQRGVMRYAIY